MKITNWILKKKENIYYQGSSNGFWYDMTRGGYIKPEEVLADKQQIKEIKEAVELLLSFKQLLKDNDILNEF